MLFSQPLALVNPVRLAVDSGVSKMYPRFRSVAPPVPRPQLLTDQLRGCACCAELGMGRNKRMAGIPPDYGALRGLGLVLPSPDTFDMNALQVPSQGLP